MRPIELSLKGLHSFREEQTVDFSDLCKNGVFGIFGPTGSGKSSLLDAMTLALYGKVERAPNNTQGIINQAENELFVAFTFKLGGDGNYSTFKVERTYKRSGENHVKTAVTRLHDLTAQPVVLADKASDVNKKIETMLGLSIEDFTRAVVLPQGKFSEFLTLRGNERRQMLQRIFQLEKYGDRLIKNVKAKLQKATHEKERLEAEQQGLGEATAEAVHTAEKDVHYWEKQLTKALSDKEEIDHSWENAKQQRTWQKEWKEAVRQLEKLEEEKGSVNDWKNSLLLSEQAEGLLPFADTYLESQSEQQTWYKKEAEARARLSTAASKQEEASERLEQFKKKKQEAEKTWQEKQHVVEKAEEMKQEIEKYSKQQAPLQEKLEKIKARVDHYLQKEEKLKADLHTYQEAVQRFQNQLSEFSQTLKDKYTMFSAKEEKQHILHLQHHYHQIQEEERQNRTNTEHLSAQVKEKDSELTQSQQLLSERFRQLMYWYNKGADDLRWIQRQIDFLDHWAEERKKEEHRLKGEEMAAYLAVQLTDGEACPVCGSDHHPYPRKIKAGSNVEKTAEKRQKLEDWLHTLREDELAAKQREWLLQQIADSLAEEAEEAIRSASASLAEEEDSHVPEIGNKEEWEKTLQHKHQELERERPTITYLQEQVEKEKKYYHQLINEKTELDYQLDAAAKAWEEKQEQSRNLKQQIERAVEAWKTSYPDLSFNTLEENYKKMREEEEQKEQLQKRIEEGTNHIQELQRQLEQLGNERYTITMEQTETKATLDQISAQREEKQKYLSKMLNGSSVEKLKADVKELQKEWDTKEQNIVKENDQTAKEKQEAENQHSVAVHALAEAEKRVHSAAQKWYEQLSKCRDMPEDPAVLKEIVLSQTQKEEYRKGIEEHENLITKWHNTKENLEQKLEDQHISEEEWANIEEKRQKVHEIVNEAREKRAAAAETFKEIQKKQERYQFLEKTRKEWDSKAVQYYKLDQVFRGRGFIEFLAEEQLLQVTRTASEWLRGLTRGRYAIEVNSQGGFIIRDNANAGYKRPVSSLSGGETFLTSLALALALSSSIQLKGQYPLEFFFLDEGFGTLDQELLDTVMTSLEKLQMDNLAVGIISHVPDIQERLGNKIIVTEAEAGGRGSRIQKAHS
ncbi:AAA family ATPase [Salibacterium aidingense]|uniref:AAA family ATPase n=1 Tax=Salibacterium aidingense TaxID=384933 RepID=UPI00041F0AFB|nr:AAA family ATPase [Salibacterium aidingense]